MTQRSPKQPKSRARGKKREWKTPVVLETSCGLEINCYAAATI